MDYIIKPEIIPSGPDHKITRTQSQAATVCKQIGNSKFAGYIRIIETEFRNYIRYPVIPVELLLINKHPKGSSGKCLAVGGNPEEGIWINFTFCIQGTHSISPGMNDFIVFYHRNSNSGNIEGFHCS